MNIIRNCFPQPPAPVTEDDFHDEMLREALKDLLIQGYHMAPNGMELFLETITAGPSIADFFKDD